MQWFQRTLVLNPTSSYEDSSNQPLSFIIDQSFQLIGNHGPERTWRCLPSKMPFATEPRDLNAAAAARSGFADGWEWTWNFLQILLMVQIATWWTAHWLSHFGLRVVTAERWITRSASPCSDAHGLLSLGGDSIWRRMRVMSKNQRWISIRVVRLWIRDDDDDDDDDDDWLFGCYFHPSSYRPYLDILTMSDITQDMTPQHARICYGHKKHVEKANRKFGKIARLFQTSVFLFRGTWPRETSRWQ